MQVFTSADQLPDRKTAAALPCGKWSEPRPGGGWLLYWNNCWGEVGKGTAPVWHNVGFGNSYTNIVSSTGEDLCVLLRHGWIARWSLPPYELPPEPADYTGVTFCMT